MNENFRKLYKESNYSAIGFSQIIGVSRQRFYNIINNKQVLRETTYYKIMKTLELKLKKDVLIVDAEGLEITQALIFNKFGNYNLSCYDYICKGSELTEEIASELVDETIMYEKHKVKCYRYRSYRDGFVAFDNAIESFISAVESKGFYWLKNHIKHPKDYEVFPDSLSMYVEQEKLHLEAEEKTFRNPLIFVKK